MIRADLHTHTLLSDGQLTPAALVSLMISEGVQYLSITDHDCLDAYQQIGPQDQIELIPGVEFSARWETDEFHILGFFPPYFLQQPNEGVVSFLAKTQQNRKKRALEFLRKLGELGMTVRLQDVSRFQEGPVLTRYHLAQTLSALGYTASIQSAFQKYLEYKKPMMSLTENTVESVIQIIHQANGLAFWAHPPVSLLPYYLPRFVELGLDGLEMVRTAGPRIHSLCKEHQLLVSWGTDFHSYQRDRKVGMLVDELIFASFRERLGFPVLKASV